MDRQHGHWLRDQLRPGHLAAVVNVLPIMADEEDEDRTEGDRRTIATSGVYVLQKPDGGIPVEPMVATSKENK